MNTSSELAGRTTGGARAEALRTAVSAVVDPELRVITIAELGILREVRVGEDDRATVVITPTYSGCPAMDVIRADIRAAATDAGFPDADVRTVLSPAWSTDMITESGRRALRGAGIAPPGPAGSPDAPACPRCAAGDDAHTHATGAGRQGPVPVQISRYGSTACQSLWRCEACREPFNAVKAL